MISYGRATTRADSWIACNVRPRHACSLCAGTTNEIMICRKSDSGRRIVARGDLRSGQGAEFGLPPSPTLPPLVPRGERETFVEYANRFIPLKRSTNEPSFRKPFSTRRFEAELRCTHTRERAR